MIVLVLILSQTAMTQVHASDSPAKSATEVKTAEAAPETVYTPPALILYSETSYQSLIDDLVHQTKATYGFVRTQGWRLYAGLALDQDSRSDVLNLYNDNHASAILGVSKRFAGIPISFYAEGRQAFRAGSLPRDRANTEPYFQGGVLGYHWQDLAQLPVRSKLFAEGYGEVVESTLVYQGLAGAGWIKAGTRTPFAGVLTADFYAEGVLKRSSREYQSENLQEIGPGARLTAHWGRISTGASVRRGFGTYSDAPRGASGYSNWTALLVLAGEM